MVSRADLYVLIPEKAHYSARNVDLAGCCILLRGDSRLCYGRGHSIAVF